MALRHLPQSVDALDKSALGRDQLVELIDIFLYQGAVSRAHSTEVSLHYRAWHRLATAPGRWSWLWAARAVAASEHLCLGLMHEADSLLKFMQVTA